MNSDMASDFPLVSVVIPTHDRAHLISQTLRCVLAQTVSNIEVVVVDDCSSDGTEKEVALVGDPRIRFIRHEVNKGAATARNTGIESARGAYVAFLDSDDEWHPQKLEKQLQIFQADPELGYVYCGWDWADGETRKLKKRRLPSEDGSINGLPRWTYNVITDLLLTIEAARNTMFDTSMKSYEPMSLLLRLASRYRGGFVPEILVTNLEHAGPRNSSTKRRVDYLNKMLVEHEAFIRTDRAAWAHLNFTAGAQYLRYHGEPAVARPLLWRAVVGRPLRLKPWIYAAACFLPSSTR